MNRKIIFWSFVFGIFLSFQLYCQPQKPSIGNEQLTEYLPLLKKAKVGLVINTTSLVHKTLLLDTLLSLGVNVRAIFAPEHGFRADADAGAKIQNETDSKTGLPIISLYGKMKQPSAEDLKNIDVLIFDIQDVGVRFYTYISTLTEIMEACATHQKHLIVLDRYHPHLNYIDGPVLKDSSLKSFVGMHSVPIVYGMSIGEYAKMVKGEKWLKNKKDFTLTVIRCQKLQREKCREYPFDYIPSPNLKTKSAVIAYPSICLFEGTNLSLGRGTSSPFLIYGSPDMKTGDTTFTPQPMPGAMTPPLQGKLCKGYFLHDTQLPKKEIDLSHILSAKKQYSGKEFFLKNGFFDKLAGNRTLRTQIEKGIAISEIKNSWKKDLIAFDKIRKKYLLY